MKRKRIIAFGLGVLILLLSCGVGLYALTARQSVSPNVLLLESLKNNRSWVIDSLVDGDFSNNPYTQVIPQATELSFLEDILSNYKNDAAFKLLVDSMETYKNTGTYVTNWSQELIAVLLHALGLLDDETLLDYVDNCVKSVDDLQYENIINAVLSENYTSSWGSTLFEADSDLEQYRQMSETMQALSQYQKALKDNNDLLSAGYFSSDQDFMDYTDNFLTAYEDALYNALVNLPGGEQFSDNEALTKKMIGVSALAFVLGAETYDPTNLSDVESSDYQGARLSEIYNTYFADGIGAFLNASGTALKIGSVATEYAILLETLVAQKDTTVQVMNRIRNNTSDLDLANTLNMYADMVADQGDTQALAYDVIVDYVSKQDTIGEAVLKGAGNLFHQYLNRRCGYFDGNKMVMTNAISENLIRAGKCVEIAVWVADKATNIQETSQKIYICKYIEKVIQATVETYEADYAAYLNDPTDENAKRVLDDLEFLKKLRLYGEKQAYGSVCSQTESIIGILLGGGDVQDNIDRRYQGNIDALLGCTLSPSSNLEFNVGSGETLELYAFSLDNGGYTVYAQYTKADGTRIAFPEADTILATSLTLNGGSVHLYGGTKGFGLFLPMLESTGNSTLTVSGADVAIGNLTNEGTLTVNLEDAVSTLQITDGLENSGTLQVDGAGQSVRVQTAQNSGTWDLNGATADVYGDLVNNGSVSGQVNVCGDGSSVYDPGYAETEVQTLSGNGTYTDLSFRSDAKQGVKIEGTQTVTGSLACTNTRLRTSENLVVTGNCTIVGGAFENSLTFRDYQTAQPLTLGGTGVMKGAVTFGAAVTFRDGLFVTDDCTTLTLNGETTVKGDLRYDGGTIAGSDWLKLHGDLDINTEDPQIANLDFVGLLPQSVNTTADLTVENLNNQNMSLSGVEFTSKIYVTDTLYSASTAAYAQGQNVVLTGNAKLNGNTIRGNISAEDWNCTSSVEIQGVLYASGGITVAEGANITAAGYQQSSGTLTLAANSLLDCNDSITINASLSISPGSTLQSEGDLLLGGTTTNSGAISAAGDCKLTGALTGGTLSVGGSLDASAALSPDDLQFESKVAQHFSNTAATTVKRLTIRNSSRSGFTVGSVIQVTERFTNECANLINGDNIRLTGGAEYTDNGETKGDFSVSGNYTVKSGTTLTVNGDLYLQEGAVLTVEDGATLSVRRSVLSGGASVIVKSGGTLEVADHWSSASDTFQIDGDLTITGDAKWTSATVSAAGCITFRGDLAVSGGTWHDPNVAFISKLPQVVSGSSFTVGDLTVDNTSNTGIRFDTTVTPSGTAQYLHMSKNDAAQSAA